MAALLACCIACCCFLLILLIGGALVKNKQSENKNKEIAEPLKNPNKPAVLKYKLIQHKS